MVCARSFRFLRLRASRHHASAYASLLLTVLLVLWLKFAELVHAIWLSVKRATLDVLDFKDELRDRRNGPRRTATEST